MKKSKKNNKHEVVVKVQAVTTPTEKDLEPVKDGGKYMIPKTWMSERQVLRMVQKTPPQHVYSRPAKGGGTWQYVTGNYVEKVLNYTFGWNWDFEVTSHGREENQVWVLGKLTVKDNNGHSIIKTQFGRADIKFRKNSKEILDYGNDLKAATTDSLKKCASLLGIASDIYGKTEFKQETGAEISQNQVDIKQLPEAKVGPSGDPVVTCSGCDAIVTPQEATYSKRIYGKIICKECQKNVKK